MAIHSCSSFTAPSGVRVVFFCWLCLKNAACGLAIDTCGASRDLCLKLFKTFNTRGEPGGTFLPTFTTRRRVFHRTLKGKSCGHMSIIIISSSSSSEFSGSSLTPKILVVADNTSKNASLALNMVLESTQLESSTSGKYAYHYPVVTLTLRVSTATRADRSISILRF